MPPAWFRFYSEVLNDPKIQRLPVDMRWHWVELLCLASEQPLRGTLPPNDTDIGFALRLSAKKARQLIVQLMDRGLIEYYDDEERVLSMHGWERRQYQSDDGSLRVRRYRDRLLAMGESPDDYRKLRPRVLERDGNQCVYCGATQQLVVDHALPIILGGDSRFDNLVTACKACNSGKAGRSPEMAGYIFKNKEAEARYNTVVGLLHRVEDVTNTPSDTDTDTEQKQRQNRAEPERARGGDLVALFAGFGSCNEYTSQAVEDAIEEYSEDWTRRAIKVAGRSAEGRPKWAFVETILQRWKANGGPDDDKPRLQTTGNHARRGSGVAATGDEVVASWERVKADTG